MLGQVMLGYIRIGFYVMLRHVKSV